MAIKIDVKDYCSECCDFEPDVMKPERTTTSCTNIMSERKAIVIQTDTIVRCKYRNRCEAIKRYLSQQMKGDK